MLPAQPRWLSLIYFFSLTSISSIFFRAVNIDDAWLILKRIFTLAKDPQLSLLIGVKIVFLILMIAAELATRRKEFPLQNLNAHLPRWMRWTLYYIMIVLLIRFYEPLKTFIYFQF